MMETYITCLLQMLSFSSRCRRLEMENLFRRPTIVAYNISQLLTPPPPPRLPPPECFTGLYWATDSRNNWISSSVQENQVFVTFDIVLYRFDKCLLLSFAFIKHMFNIEYF